MWARFAAGAEEGWERVNSPSLSSSLFPGWALGQGENSVRLPDFSALCPGGMTCEQTKRLKSPRKSLCLSPDHDASRWPSDPSPICQLVLPATSHPMLCGCNRNSMSPLSQVQTLLWGCHSFSVDSSILEKRGTPGLMCFPPCQVLLKSASFLLLEKLLGDFIPCLFPRCHL